MKRITAYTGEFGLKVYFHAPVVYAMGAVPVEIEAGDEALYPRASEWHIVEREPETTPEASRRRGGVGRPKISGPAERFVPEPHETITSSGPPWDFVVCPRKRAYGDSKNWDGWPALTYGLRRLNGGSTLVAAAGAPDSSYDVGVGAAWEDERFLDLSIHMMLNTRLVIATDAGLAHLAVLCGAPLLLVTYRGLVAPGPVIDSSGRKARDSYWRAGYDPAERVNRFEDANHTDSPIEYVDGWEDPAKVVEVAERMTAQPRRES